MDQQLHRAVGNQEQDIDNGKLAGYCILCQVPYPCEYIGLTTTADQSRVIEVLTEALVKAQEHLKTHQHPFETAEYQHAVDMYNEIKVALVEAQRIQEGK
jgi:hypothetical protein